MSEFRTRDYYRAKTYKDKNGKAMKRGTIVIDQRTNNRYIVRFSYWEYGDEKTLYLMQITPDNEPLEEMKNTIRNDDIFNFFTVIE